MISLEPEPLLIVSWTKLAKSTFFCGGCCFDVNTKQCFICFSKSFFWLVCLLSDYCAAVTEAQLAERNAVNFLVALGEYGLFFLFRGAYFVPLPSLTSCLGA